MGSEAALAHFKMLNEKGGIAAEESDHHWVKPQRDGSCISLI